ncbi:MAG: lipoate protein ligase C-terminal domain-containing protein [Nitrososphaerota archaeon]
MTIVKEGSFKAPKGLIKVRVESADSEISSIIITGDFFMYPEDQLWELEKKLRRTSINRKEILKKVREFYEESNVITPGVSPEDFCEAVIRALQAEDLSGDCKQA